MPYIDIKPIHFQNACSLIESDGIFVMNMITADLDTMIQWVDNAIQDGIVINNIELGSEINHNNEYNDNNDPQICYQRAEEAMEILNEQFASAFIQFVPPIDTSLVIDVKTIISGLQ